MATSPAAYLNILLTANTTAANVALAKTQAQLTATGATATKTGATMKKAMLGIGVAAVGAGVALYKIGEEFDAASDKIRVGTGATGKELKRLEQNFKNVVSAVPASFEDASQAIADLNTRMGLTGKPLEKMTKQVTELSRITKTDVAGNVEATSKAFVDWEVKTKDMSKTLDGFFRVSQESGASVGEMMEAVQKFGSPLRQLGFDLEEAAAMWGTFVRAGVNTQTMVPGLKLALSNLTAPVDELRTKMDDLGIAVGKPDEALREVFDLLGDASTLSKMDKITLAMDVFGKRAGADMAEAIKQGRFEVDKMMEVFRNGEDTIRKAGRDTMDLSEHWQQFTNLLKVQLEPVATEVFEGLGDLMKEMTKTFKRDGVEGVLDLLIEKFEEALPKIADLGAKLGVTLAKGVGKAFIDSSILGKLFIGAAALRLFGGPGVFGKLGVAMGKKVAGTFATTIAAESAGGQIAAGAQAGGKSWGRKFGQYAGPAAAVAVAAYMGSEFAKTDWAKENVANVKSFADPFSEIAESLAEVTTGLAGTGKAWGAYRKTVKDVYEFTHIVAEDWKKDLGGVAREGERMAESIQKSMRQEENAVERASGKTDRALDIISDVLGKGGDSAWRFADRSGKSFDQTDTAGDKMSKGVLSAIGSLVAGTGKGYKRFEKMTNDVLTALKVGKVAFNVSAGAGQVAGHQRGGSISGSGSGDTVPAMLEPGEFVMNRKAVQRFGPQIAQMNAAVPRFQTGGIVQQALGPYDMPPIAYDPNHAGGNSHLHLDFFTGGQAISIGQQMQKMGWSIGEFSGPSSAGFGPVTVHHQSPGHYDGTAFDANTASDETQSEVAAVVRLLGGKGVAGAVAEKIKRVLLDGPNGPLKSMGQSALDKVHAAANKFIAAKSAASVGGGFSGPIPQGGGTPSKNMELGQQMLHNAGQWPALQELWTRESGWNHLAVNPTSGAYGIPQSLPGSKMAASGPDWKTNPATQIDWGLGYIGGRYGSPAAALAFHDANNWYQQGGMVQKFAKGGHPKRLPGLGKSNKSPFGPSWTGGIDSGVTGGRIFGLAELAKAQQLKKALDAAVVSISMFDEQVDIADTLAGLASSEFGSELGPNERSALVALHEQLLATVKGSGYIASIGRSVVGKGMTLASGSTRESLADLAETFGSAVTDAFGLTGRGGRVFELGLKVNDLKTGTATDPTNPVADLLNIAGLRDIIQAAQFGVFAGQLPKFHGGGVVPGPVGQERPIMALGGERYLGPGQSAGQTLHADIVINLDGQIVRRSIEVELTERDRASRQAQRAGV